MIINNETQDMLLSVNRMFYKLTKTGFFWNVFKFAYLFELVSVLVCEDIWIF